MEKNDEIKTVHSPTKRVNKKLLIVVGVVVVVLIAAVIYITATLINQNVNKNTKPAAAKPKLVAPAKIMTSLQSANDTTKASYDQHATTRAAFDEQPVKLVK